MPKDATGNVTIEIDGKIYTANVQNGVATFNVKGLEAGGKTVVARYLGDDYFQENYTTAKFTVKKKTSPIVASSMDITVGKDEIITVTLPKDATGRVVVNVNGEEYYGDVVNGRAKIRVPELASGRYRATVTYEGDSKYLPSKSTVTSFKVDKVTSPISTPIEVIQEGQNGVVRVNLPDDATGTVIVTIDGKKYTLKLVDGKAELVIPGLRIGDHKITVFYSGDAKYAANITISQIIVKGNDSPDPSPANSKQSEIAGNLSEYPTANPIWMLLLALLALGTSQVRRFKK